MTLAPAGLNPMFNSLRNIALTIVLGVIIYGITFIFFGESTITATLDGKPVHTQVWINGNYAGETPYTDRFGIGMTQINVLPPDDKDTEEVEWNATLLSTGLGRDVTAPFTTK